MQLAYVAKPKTSEQKRFDQLGVDAIKIHPAITPKNSLYLK